MAETGRTIPTKRCIAVKNQADKEVAVLEKGKRVIKMAEKKTRAYIYTRVSTAMQVEGYSLDAQKERMTFRLSSSIL